jgi:hypothetical protein
MTKAEFEANYPGLFHDLCNAFEDAGGCGHDLGFHGALAIVQRWEALRSEAAAADVKVLILDLRET